VTQRHLASFALGGLALVAVAWLVRGSDGRAGPAGKSGGTTGLVLRLAVLEYPGKPAAQIAERYAQRVEGLSKGSIRLTLMYWPTRFERTTPSSRVEASAIRAVRAAEPQLGLIPSHAFEAQGVTTFRSLQAPLLITSAAQVARVTTGALGDRLQAGLTGLGLTGLGLVPEGLQRPFGFLKPLVSPADFAAVTIRADSSRATRDVLRILGARPVAIDVAGIGTSVYSGFANDAVSLPSADDDFPQAAHTAGNIALFPKVDVLVSSTNAFGRLTPEQQAVLRRAAVEARAASIPAAGERAAAAAFCRAGGTIVAATPSELRALRTKVAPLLDAMRREPATSATLASIERLGHGGRPGVPPCAPGQIEPVVESGSDAPASMVKSLMPPAGSYRRAFTVAELRAAGANETEARSNQGVATLTFYGLLGSPRFVVEWQGPSRPPCRGRVEFPDRLVGLRWNSATPCTGYVAFSWKPAARGDVTIVELDPRTEPGWVEKAYLGTWKRVDCTPNCGARDKLSAGEAARLLQRGLPREIYVACHRVTSFAWDYECSYKRDKGYGERIGARFGVDVDDRRITRTSNG
jgi:TRAP-type C4-dicarboxylate transport system substrate-binding protein